MEHAIVSNAQTQSRFVVVGFVKHAVAPLALDHNLLDGVVVKAECDFLPAPFFLVGHAAHCLEHGVVVVISTKQVEALTTPMACVDVSHDVITCLDAHGNG